MFKSRINNEKELVLLAHLETLYRLPLIEYHVTSLREVFRSYSSFYIMLTHKSKFPDITRRR